MKIIILCGPGEVNKRAEMLLIKQQFSENTISVYDLSINKLSDIDLALTSQSLFTESNKLIIIENTPDDVDLKKLVKKDNPATLLFLASNVKPLSKLLSNAREINAKIINFEAEKEVLAFPYLDSLVEGKKNVFGELQQLLNEYGGMYILSMIYYLLRRNLLPLPKSIFMQKKIIAQKQTFSEGDWSQLYRMTLKADFVIKSGNLPENIALTKLTQEFIHYLR